MDHLCKEIMKYEGLLLPHFYNQFFNPNICHVCKSRSNGNLISCDRCNLVSYCTNDHKLLHSREHNEICITIFHCLNLQGNTLEGDNKNDSFNWKNWIALRKSLLLSVQEEIGRSLKPHEKQMILWPNTCILCLESDQLWTCERCFSVNYCHKHKGHFRIKHTKGECQLQTVSLNIKIGRMSFQETNMSYDFLKYIKPNIPLIDMLFFLMENIVSPKGHSYYTAMDYVLSDYLSGPLTIYSGLKERKLLTYLKEPEPIIHIIIANSIDVDGVRTWELLPHFLPEIRKLTIVFIGPEIEPACGKLDCCSSCVKKEMEISFECKRMSYHDYMQESQERKVPNIIAGFQMEPYKGETWAETVKVIQAVKCPLLLGALNKKIGQDNIQNIQEILQIPIMPIFEGQNNFCSYVPLRDFETGGTCVRNEYLIIYSNLYNRSSKVSSST